MQNGRRDTLKHGDDGCGGNHASSGTPRGRHSTARKECTKKAESRTWFPVPQVPLGAPSRVVRKSTACGAGWIRPGLGGTIIDNVELTLFFPKIFFDLRRSPHLADLRRFPHLADLRRFPHLADLRRFPHLADLRRFPHLADLRRSPHLADLRRSTHRADLRRSTHLADLRRSTHLADLRIKNNIGFARENIKYTSMTNPMNFCTHHNPRTPN
jgi:hypothetical protein